MKIKHPNHAIEFLAGGGEMGELTRTKDWSKTSLGPLSTWPQSLHTTLSILLNSKFPMFLWWGPELICFYNDAYRPSLGQNGKHPFILGMRAEEAWAEIWDVIKPLIEQVLSGSGATWSEDQLIPIYRNGKIQDVYWTFSYSPISDESGTPVGVFVTCAETTEKVLTRKKLEESKEQLEFAIEAAQLGTFDYNPLANKFSANNRLKKWFGLPADEQIELHHALNRIAESDRQRVTLAIQKALDFSSGGNYDIEYTIVHPVTQEETIVHAKGIAWFNEQKTAYRFNGTLEDVTEQATSLKKLAESEQRFQAAVAAVKGILWTNNAKGEMEGEQPGWSELTGQQYNEYQGFGWSKAVHPDDVQPTIAAWNEAVRERKMFLFEHRVKMKNGSWKEFSVRAIPLMNDDGFIREWVGVHTDITDEKRAERALRENQEKLNIVIDASELGTFVLNLKTDFVECSDRFHQIFGYFNGDRLTHTQFINHLHPDDVLIRKNAFTKALESGILDYESRIIWHDNSIHWIQVKGKIFHDDAFNSSTLIGTCRDVTDEKTHQKILEESEQRFRKVADSAPVLIWMSGIDKRCHFFNTAWLTFTGRTLEQEDGNGWTEGVHPDDFKRCSDGYVEAFDKREEFYMEYRLKRFDGEYRWISDKGVPRFTTDGLFEGYIGACMDIHERIVYQKKLQEDDERLNIVIEASELGTWEIDLKSEEVVYTKRFLEILGFKDGVSITLDEMQNQIHPEEMELRDNAYKKAFETGVLDYTGRIVWRDGTIHWLENKGKVFYDDKREPSRIMGTTRDVTNETLQQQVLSKNEQKFRLLADSMPQHIWTSDPEGNLNYYNQSVFDYSGLTLEHFNSDGWIQIVHPDDREENIRQWIDSVTTGKDFLFEHRFRKHTGEYRWQLSRAIPQRDEHGKIQMWVGSSTDIHDKKEFTDELERKVLERTQQLNGKNTELEKMNKDLQSFAYISSHDLQEPLRKIQTFATRIVEKEYQNLSDGGKDYFKRMQGAAKRMQLLIDDLLSYSRTSTAERNYKNTDLNEIVEEVKADLKEELEQKNATIQTNEMCEANIIPFQFRQLLHNLISNSLKFSSPERTPLIKIESKIENNPKFEADKLLHTEKYCHVRISDNGIGFEPQYNEKIFELFQRLHGKAEYAGTGIGLAIVKKIVDNHNGVITANAELNKGATFDIYIPVLKA